jgi:PadR family transcriptional regulator, regulatory protein AphA
MSLPHILLGLLEEPASGYDIKREFEQSLSFFWSAALAQIYPALKKLEKDGLVSSWQEPSEKGPARTVYQQTEKGREAFRDWLEEGPQLNTERRAYLAQAYFLAQSRAPDEPRSFYEQLRDDFRARADRLTSLEDVWRDDHGPAFPDNLTGQALYEHMTFDLGQRVFRLYVDWAEDCLARIDAAEKD